MFSAKVLRFFYLSNDAMDSIINCGKKALFRSIAGGIGHNKLVAKLAGNCHKPNQQTTVLPWLANELIASLPSARSVPGIGRSTFKLLEANGLATVESIRNSSIQNLATFLGWKNY
jgi:nucleotidyltransferase/DNA polymerase involved in DNA repair